MSISIAIRRGSEDVWATIGPEEPGDCSLGGSRCVVASAAARALTASRDSDGVAYCERCGELLADDLHELVAFVVLKLDTLGVAHVALGQDGRDIPTLPPDLENLAREIRRSEVGVPVPAPRSNTEALAA